MLHFRHLQHLLFSDTWGPCCTQIAAELEVQPEVVRIIVSGTEFRNDAAQLHSHNVQLPLQLQVCGLLAMWPLSSYTQRGPKVRWSGCGTCNGRTTAAGLLTQE